MTARALSLADRSPVEFLYSDFAAEHASTRRMLERFPDGKGDWRPHEKSRTLAQLATHVASILSTGALVLQTDELDLLARAPPHDEPPRPPPRAARCLLPPARCPGTRGVRPLGGRLT